jgi:RNA polymerase sigma-70 factor (family 1)
MFLMRDTVAGTDHELLSRMAEGDQGSFNVLFERYRNRIFGYLFTILKSKEVAEEITLDVFLKIWEGRTTATEINHLEAFLFRVARNKALDFFRQLQKSREEQTALWHRMQDQLTTGAADHALLFADVEAAVRQAVDKLSPQRKMVFQLSRDHGLTYEQIAAQLQISSNTVRNHLAASLQFIRTQLDTSYQLTALFFLLKSN